MANNNEFDYIFDIRNIDGEPIVIPGIETPFGNWREVHIRGALPLNMTIYNVFDLINVDNYARECDTFGPFGQSYQGCKDKKILILCWTGEGANHVIKWLTEKCGWTNVYAAGPEGESGAWHYPEMQEVIDMGMVVHNDTT